MGNCDSSQDDVYDPRRGRWYSSRNGPWQSHTQRVPIGNGMHRDPMMMPGYGHPSERVFASSGGMPPPGYSRFGGGDFYGGPEPFPSRYGGPLTR